MGSRGPAPKPTIQKLLEGTYRPDRANGSEVFPEAAPSLSPPDWLISSTARAKWNELAPILSSYGLLTVCDLDTLALYCSVWTTWREAEERLTSEGTTTTARSGYQQVSPHYTIAKNALTELRQLGDRLGLSPSARGRIHASPIDDQEDGWLA